MYGWEIILQVCKITEYKTRKKNKSKQIQIQINKHVENREKQKRKKCFNEKLLKELE